MTAWESPRREHESALRNWRGKVEEMSATVTLNDILAEMKDESAGHDALDAALKALEEVLSPRKALNANQVVMVRVTAKRIAAEITNLAESI